MSGAEMNCINFVQAVRNIFIKQNIWDRLIFFLAINI